MFFERNDRKDHVERRYFTKNSGREELGEFPVKGNLINEENTEENYIFV